MMIEAVTMKRRKRAIRTLAVCGVLLAASLGLWRWLVATRSQVCRLPDGSTLTLLGTTYGRHHQWMSRVRTQGLWADLLALFHPESRLFQFDTPTDALVLWMRSDRDKGLPFYLDANIRIEVSDSGGNRQVTDF